jgi:hypothetical protein
MDENRQPEFVEVMTNEWLSIEQAAIALECSTRTIARKIKSGELETRTDEDGRRLVLICRPKLAEPEPAPEAVSQPTDNPRREMVVAHGYGGGEVVVKALQVIVDDSRHEAQKARQTALYAWAAAVSFVLITGGVLFWAGTALTQDQVTTHVLKQQLDDADTAVAALKSERDDLRDQLTVTQENASRAEGELLAVERTSRDGGDAQPTSPAPSSQSPSTQPSVLDRLAAMIER